MVDVEAVSRFLALLALAALAGAVVCLVALAWRGGPLERLRDDLTPVALPVAFLVSLTATAGSLYYSEVADFVPCELCWFQRIFMYPLPIVLGIASVRRDLDVRRYVVPLAAVGLAISVYHYQLQLFPDQGSSCDLSAPCTARWVEQLGFVSIPFMAGAGFAAVIAVLSAARDPRRTPDGDEASPLHTPEPDRQLELR